jgi:hypothetical protein
VIGERREGREGKKERRGVDGGRKRERDAHCCMKCSNGNDLNAVQRNAELYILL